MNNLKAHEKWIRQIAREEIVNYEREQYRKIKKLWADAQASVKNNTKKSKVVSKCDNFCTRFL